MSVVPAEHAVLFGEMATAARDPKVAELVQPIVEDWHSMGFRELYAARRAAFKLAARYFAAVVAADQAIERHRMRNI